MLILVIATVLSIGESELPPIKELELETTMIDIKPSVVYYDTQYSILEEPPAADCDNKVICYLRKLDKKLEKLNEKMDNLISATD